MSLTKYNNILGTVATGQPATIRFFGKITEETANRFNHEFDYLESVVRPSLIRVLINCEGGSVLHGMSTYSTIQNSTVPTECINEGMAASMGSIIWAAGQRSLMRDYAILMIHNPFIPAAEDEEPNDMVLAFTNQIRTIYRKRFGLSEAHIKSIMEGRAGKDGTFFDCEAAVRAGIVSPGNILETSEQIRQKVKNELSALVNATEIQDMMSRISAQVEEPETGNNHSPENIPNVYKTHNKSEMNEGNNKTSEYAAITASLGFTDKDEVKDVMARISELTSVEAKLENAKQDLADSEIALAGKDTSIQNLQKDLGEAKASIAVYEQKEKEALRKENMATVQDAKDKGKITEEATEHWMAFLESNRTLALDTLNSIPAREQISKEIAHDPANVKAAATATTTAEAELAEKVRAVVGDEFKFGELK